MIDQNNPIDMPVFFPFGRPGDFLADKPTCIEDMVRKLYGDDVEFRVPQSVTYTEFAAPASDRAKFGPMVFGDAGLSAEDLALLPTQDDLPQHDRVGALITTMKESRTDLLSCCVNLSLLILLLAW